MTMLAESEARRLWEKRLAEKGWTNRSIRCAMFDWCPSMGPISYRPAPAWPTIADRDNRASRESFDSLVEHILRQGERFSSMGRAFRGNSRTEIEFRPVSVDWSTICSTIKETMEVLHPGAVTQEQILRSAFIAHLPDKLRLAVGTLFSTVHPERPTPSNTYIRTGSRQMKARYDIGFGHPRSDEGIVGAMELKVVGGSILQLLRGVPTGELASSPGNRSRKKRDTLSDDFQKLLDLRLPSGAARVSWVVARRGARSTPRKVEDLAREILDRTAVELRLPAPMEDLHTDTGWRRWTWPDTGVSLFLAWYQPSAAQPAEFESVWTACE